MDRFRGDRSPFGEPRRESPPLRGEGAPQRAAAREWDPDVWYQQMLDSGLVKPEPRLLTRRNFLVGGAALAGAAAVDWSGRFSPLAKRLDDKLFGQYDYDALVKKKKIEMKERYGIDLVMGQEKGQDVFTGDPVPLEKYRATLRYLEEELYNYPPEMVQKIGKGKGFTVRIVHGLRHKVEEQDGAGERRVRYYGMAPFLRKGKPAEFILDADQSELGQRHVVHHELNHRFSMELEDQGARDRKWIGFHKAVSKSSPYRPVPNGVKSYQRPPERYFLTEYAGKSPIEDQAVCAEWVMDPNALVEFLDRWGNEKDEDIQAVLAAKYLETTGNYFAWSDGEINEEFWRKKINVGLERRQERVVRR